MHAPVETPENRESVIRATCLPYERCFSAAVIWYTSSMPVPSGPPQVSTMICPALILKSSSVDFMARMASRSDMKTRAVPRLR